MHDARGPGDGSFLQLARDGTLWCSPRCNSSFIVARLARCRRDNDDFRVKRFPLRYHVVNHLRAPLAAECIDYNVYGVLSCTVTTRLLFVKIIIRVQRMYTQYARAEVLLYVHVWIQVRTTTSSTQKKTRIIYVTVTYPLYAITVSLLLLLYILFTTWHRFSSSKVQTQQKKKKKPSNNTRSACVFCVWPRMMWEIRSIYNSEQLKTFDILYNIYICMNFKCNNWKRRF